MHERDAAGSPLSEHAAVETQPTLWQATKADCRAVTGPKLLAVIGVLAWMAFQWGWGNDIILPPLATWAFEAFDDGATWPSAALATAAATGTGAGFWALTQTIDAVVVLSGLRLIPSITGRISRSLQKSGLIKPFAELSLLTKFGLAYISGASLLCLLDVFATGAQGLRRRSAMVAQAVALSATGVALVVAIVAGATATGARIPATADEADTVIRYAGNPLTWIVIYGSIFVGSLLRSLWQRNDPLAR